MQESPPYDKGIIETLHWAMETNIPMQQIPSDKNWCNSGYKAYYGGVIPGHFQPKEAATNFVMSSLGNVKVPDNPNKPTITKLITDSFFIILMDIRDENDVKSHIFFYDGIKTLKNFKKRNVSLKEITIMDVGERNKSWQKINIDQMQNMTDELKCMFEEFNEKVKLQQHEDNCQCPEHDPTGHDESSDQISIPAED